MHCPFWLRIRAPLSALCLALTAGASPAWGQTSDQAAARALFTEGRRLMKEGKYELACPKLEAARKIYSGSGVVLNLGDCYAHTGRLATAWATFGDAVDIASRAGRGDDELEAKRRQTELEPRLMRVAIRVTKDVPTLAVRRDGRTVDRGAWETPIPVDPGTHEIGASADGYAPWSTSIAIDKPGETETVTVPELVPLAPPPSAPAVEVASAPAPAAPPPYWTGRRIAGVVVAGAGVLASAGGGALALVAKSRFDSAENENGTARHADSVGAVGMGNAATVLLAAGGAVAVTGLVIWLSAPSASVKVGTNGTALWVTGRF